MSALNPLVSVCIPAFNCEFYVKEALECVCCQTYKNLEIIVVNDGSTDSTLSIIQSVKDTRITVLSTANKGAASARNTAYTKATGDYTMFFDADDYLNPEFIAQQLSVMAGRKDVVVLSGWGRFYDGDLSTFVEQKITHGDLTLKEWVKTYWYKCSPMTNPGRVLMPKEIIDKAGRWNDELSLNDDLDFFTRVFMACQKIVFNKESVFYYRSGVNGLSTTKGHKAYKSLYLSILLSVKNVMIYYKHDKDLLKSCANMFQSFIYEAYPEEKELINLAKMEIKGLTKPDFAFPAGGFTKVLKSLVGWKIAKRIKRLVA